MFALGLAPLGRQVGFAGIGLIGMPRVFSPGLFLYESDQNMVHENLSNRHSVRQVLLKYPPLFLSISLCSALLLWTAIVRLANLPAYILPGPSIVWQRFLRALSDGSLLTNTAYTLLEVLLGMALGVSTATLLGYLLAKFRTLEKLLSPYIIASQSIPVVAIAPLLVIWFPSLFSKVLVCALIVFFPVLINTVVGMRSVPEDLRDMMRSLQADRWQTFKLLELPGALPVFLGGLRIGATLSVIGAVVGEFVGADRGLGFLINVARGVYDTSLVFVAVFTLVGMALTLYGAVVLLENHLLAWQKRPESHAG